MVCDGNTSLTGIEDTPISTAMNQHALDAVQWVNYFERKHALPEISPSCLSTLGEWVVIWELDTRNILKIMMRYSRRETSILSPVRYNTRPQEACTSAQACQKHLPGYCASPGILRPEPQNNDAY